MKYYIINLDRSTDRWNRITSALRHLDIEPVRISAVDGKTVVLQNWMPDFDRTKFRFNHGIDALSGEYGCYASHLKALETFLNSGEESCVIFEDDALPLASMAPVIEYLNENKSHATLLVRLFTHRIEFFESLEILPENHTLGQCWFGPSGSAASY